MKNSISIVSTQITEISTEKTKNIDAESEQNVTTTENVTVKYEKIRISKKYQKTLEKSKNIEAEQLMAPTNGENYLYISLLFHIIIFTF